MSVLYCQASYFTLDLFTSSRKPTICSVRVPLWVKEGDKVNFSVGSDNQANSLFPGSK
jgi:hypothetical protein